jgi:1,2-diacylglycerol-3-alpha-glucose alpha-1,2-glucosyltransferase
MMGNVLSARRLKNALMREGIDVTDDSAEKDYDLLDVHTPVPLGNVTEVRNAKKKGIPVVIHAHTTAEDSEGTWTGSKAFSNVVGKYLTLFYNLGDLVLAPSAWTKAKLQARSVKAQIQVLSNGIDLERFKFAPERRRTFRETYAISEDAKVVYSIGVVCVKKGVETLPYVAKELADVKFIWVGRRSPFYSPLTVHKAMKKCPENVQFLHDVEDALDAHCGGDIFLTPSFAENQGIAVMEAMAVGRPVVARNLAVYEGFLENGENALLCNNESEFVAALRHLKENPDLANALVQEGKQTLSSHEIGKVAKKLIAMYNSLLERTDKETDR